MLCLVLLWACASEEPGISPPRDRFYFPTELAIDPTRPLLYVTSSNADLKYNGAIISVLDLSRLPPDLSEIGTWVTEGKLDCHPDRVDATAWECQEAQFTQPGATLRMEGFPAGIRLVPDGTRLFVPTRGKDLLLWAKIVDLGGGQVDLRCDDRCDGMGGDCELWDCDSKYLVDYSEDLQRSLPTEPYGILINKLVAVHLTSSGVRRTCQDGLLPAVGCSCSGKPPCQGPQDRECCIEPEDPDVDHVYVTHLFGGEVSFFTSSPGGVVLRDIRGGFFTPQSGIQGGFDLASRIPGDPAGEVYISSREDNVLASFVIEKNKIVDGPKILGGALYPGADNRGLAFGPGGDRLYVVNQRPPTLSAIDMSLEWGVPKQEPLWVEEVCAEPSILRLDPDRDLAYIVCFGTSQVYVIDTAAGKLVHQIPTGKGPHGFVLDPDNQRAFIANFLDNTVGVIDLDPSNSSYRRMVMRIGLAETLVRK